MSENGKALVHAPGSLISMPVPAVMSDAEIESSYRIAKALAASGFFKDARQAEQAFAKLLFGRDLGLSPTQAMTSIHIVEGKPELSANLQASLVRATPGYDYRVVEHTDDACEIVFLRHGEELGRSKFTMADAQRAGLAGRNVWKSYPRNMLFARAISNGVAFHCPEVTGGLRVYSEGEISGEEKPPEVEPPAAAAAAEPPQSDPGDAAEPPEAEVIPDPPREVIDEERADAFIATMRDLELKRPQVRMVLIDAGAESVPARGDLEVVVRTLTPAQADELDKRLVQVRAERTAAAQPELTS